MPSSREISEQLERESAGRSRLAVPALAGGVLFFMSAIIVSATLNSAPTVGLVQGLAPALRGEANPAVSPRAVEVKYISHHAFALIAASAVKGVSLLALTFALLFLLSATRFRRPQTWSLAQPLVLVGGVALALVNLVHQIVGAVRAHNFAVGHDFTNHAVEQALTKGTLNLATQYLDLFAALALTAGMIAMSLNAMRVGLLTRWMGILGMFAGLLILLPIGGATLEFIPAFWMVALGILYYGRWPNGDPPAWGSGQAEPWPTAAERRAEREDASKRAPSSKSGSRSGRSTKAALTESGAADEGSAQPDEADPGAQSSAVQTQAPEQSSAGQPGGAGSSSRKRKRKGRVRG
jgi:hypothetical protein